MHMDWKDYTHAKKTCHHADVVPFPALDNFTYPVIADMHAATLLASGQIDVIHLPRTASTADCIWHCMPAKKTKTTSQNTTERCIEAVHIEVGKTCIWIVAARKVVGSWSRRHGQQSRAEFLATIRSGSCRT